MSINALPLLSLAAVSAASCAHYPADYQQVGDQTEAQGPATASYPVPAAAPRGNLHVVSLGAEQLPAGPQGPSPFLHVRVAAENNGDSAPWTVAAHEQTLSLGGGQGLLPSFAQASSGGPTLSVAPGGRGSIDLYFALPAQGEPPLATLSWRLHRGPEIIAEATNFQRLAGREPQYGYYQPVYRPGVTLAFGPAWWWYGGWGMYGDFGPWGYRPYAYYPRPGGYYGGHYGGYYGGLYGGGRVYAAPRTGGGGRGGSGPAPRPSSGGGGGRGGWRGGRR